VSVSELDCYAVEFEAFHARFAHCFVRSEPRQAARQYLRGLLTSVKRKNCWQMAEALGASHPQGLQRLLFGALWDADQARDELEAFVVEVFGAPDGIAILDETGFVKKGVKSVGVKRQYSGTAGKVENCQVGVFLVYRSQRGTAFLDRCLYLPEEWCADPQRRVQARVPAGLTFQTKPELGIAMLERAWAHGVPMEWVSGDEVYGDSAALRQRVGQAQKKYVVAVSSKTPVWQEHPRLIPAGRGKTGRPRQRPCLAPDAVAWETVTEVVAALPATAWQRWVVGEGEKGPRRYDWVALRVFEKHGSLPGPEGWLLARRSVSDPDELAYFLSNAPADTALQTLAEVAGARWSVETAIEEAKGEAGLDEYEVRYWHSWYRHITLSMMAHAWLATMRQVQGGKPTPAGAGRAERARGTPAAGDRAAAATAQCRAGAAVVELAAGQAATGTP
jgi:SRSO17 transposase